MTLLAARNALFTVFLAHGFLIGAWAPQIVLAKERFGVGPGAFGLALLALPLGSVLAMPIAGLLCASVGSGRLTVMTGLAFCLFLLGPSFAPNLLLFVITGIALGAAIGSMDVAMNVESLSTEKALRQPIMSVLHGVFSLGCIIGAAAGLVLTQIFSASWQIVISCLCSAATMLIASRFFKPADGITVQAAGLTLPSRATLLLGCLCFLALMAEGSVLDWGAIYLREVQKLDASLAAMAFGIYQGGMAAARFAGDRLRLAFGAVRLVFCSAMLCAFGTGLALASDKPGLALTGFAIGGLGMGNIAPVLFAGGGRLEPDNPGHGVAAITSMGYAGFLLGPPLIGLIAQASSLRAGLAVTALAALIVAGFARNVRAADSY